MSGPAERQSHTISMFDENMSLPPKESASDMTEINQVAALCPNDSSIQLIQSGQDQLIFSSTI